MFEIQTLAQQVYQHLLGEVVAGALRSGAVLNETDLARRLQVSRTPVREAIRRLAADGFIEMATARKAVVRQLRAEDVAHLYEVREALEALAAEKACGTLAAEDFAVLDALAAAASDPDAPDHREACNRLDAELHTLIARRSGNPVLAREIERFRSLMHLVRDHLARVPEGLELARQQHLAVIEALRRGDAAAARAALVGHLRTFKQLHADWVAEAQTAGDRRAV